MCLLSVTLKTNCLKMKDGCIPVSSADTSVFNSGEKRYEKKNKEMTQF
jgi:hypothetical protein